MKSIYTLFGVTVPFDATSRYTSSWLLAPYSLAILRLLYSLYAFVTTFTIFGYQDSHSQVLYSRESFSYFTNLTYWGLAFYFLFSGLHTLSYARTGESWLQRWPRPLQALHVVFYATVVTYPFLVSIVFWSILYSGPFFPIRFDAWSNISQHALNSLFALTEIILPRTLPLPIFTLVPLVVILLLYLGLAYLTHATQGFYTYSFLDPSHGKGRLAGYILGIAVGIVVIFGVVWGLIWLRKWITERKLGMEGRLSVPRAQSHTESGEAMLDLESGVEK